MAQNPEREIERQAEKHYSDEQQNHDGHDEQTEYCVVCGEEHIPSKVRSHEQAAQGYEEKYGIAI